MPLGKCDKRNPEFMKIRGTSWKFYTESFEGTGFPVKIVVIIHHHYFVFFGR